MQKEP